MELNILRPGDKPRAKLDKLQTEIAHTANARKAAEGASVSMEEARARLAASLAWPVEDAALAFESLLVPGRGHVALPKEMTLGVFAYLQGKEAFIDLVLERIAPKAGLPPEQRTASVRELNEKLRALQIAEEQEVLELERRGHVVLRRGDADVAVLLEVWADYAP